MFDFFITLVKELIYLLNFSGEAALAMVAVPKSTQELQLLVSTISARYFLTNCLLRKNIFPVTTVVVKGVSSKKRPEAQHRDQAHQKVPFSSSNGES